jgi:hypothetical protein
MTKFKDFFQRKAESGSRAQLPHGFIEEQFFLLRRQFLYEKHLKAIEIEVDGYINMSLDELSEIFGPYNRLIENEIGLFPEVLNEANFEKRREMFLKQKEMWTAKSPEEFDPRVCDSDAFDGFKEWLDERNRK